MAIKQLGANPTLSTHTATKEYVDNLTIALAVSL